MRNKKTARVRKLPGDLLTVREIIRSARGSTRQEEFARQVGSTQSLVSQYERGTVNPPAAVIDRCLEILRVRERTADTSVAAIVKAVENGLKGPKKQEVRRAVLSLLEILGVAPPRRNPS